MTRLTIGTEAKRLQQRTAMRALWTTAIFNMPWGNSEPLFLTYSPYLAERHSVGQLQALADCLGMKPHLVKRALIHGATPKNPETLHLLERFASHYGSRFAGIRLAAVGALAKYPNWPRRG